jgi:hypothetical protein
MKRVVTIAAASLVLAACEEVSTGPATTGPPGPPPPGGYMGLPPQTTFDAADFAWSTAPGSASLSGALAYRRGPVRYLCQGEDVLLIPETAWSRRRMIILYGSASAAAIPVSIVRARQPSAPSGDYARYVRRATCDSDNHFAFQGLPAGPWYVATVAKPADGQGEPIAITRRVELQSGQRTVTLS